MWSIHDSIHRVWLSVRFNNPDTELFFFNGELWYGFQMVWFFNKVNGLVPYSDGRFVLVVKWSGIWKVDWKLDQGDAKNIPEIQRGTKNPKIYKKFKNTKEPENTKFLNQEEFKKYSRSFEYWIIWWSDNFCHLNT